MKNILSSITGCALCVFAVLITGCYNDKSLPTVADEYSGTATFSSDILPMFSADCSSSGCHDGTVKPNLMPANAYNSLTSGGYIDQSNPAESKLYKWMQGLESTPMPPSGPKSKSNALILAWIKQGSLNN